MKKNVGVIFKPVYLAYSTTGAAFGVAASKNGVDGRLEVLIKRERCRLNAANENPDELEFSERLIREEENQIIAEAVRQGRDLSNPKILSSFLKENATDLLGTYYEMRKHTRERISDEFFNFLESLRGLPRPDIYERLQRASFLDDDKRTATELTLLGVHYFVNRADFAALQRGAAKDFTPQSQGIHIVCAGMEKRDLNARFFYQVARRENFLI